MSKFCLRPKYYRQLGYRVKKLSVQSIPQPVSVAVALRDQNGF